MNRYQMKDSSQHLIGCAAPLRATLHPAGKLLVSLPSRNDARYVMNYEFTPFMPTIQIPTFSNCVCRLLLTFSSSRYPSAYLPCRRVSPVTTTSLRIVRNCQPHTRSDSLQVLCLGPRCPPVESRSDEQWVAAFGANSCAKQALRCSSRCEPVRSRVLGPCSA